MEEEDHLRRAVLSYAAGRQTEMPEERASAIQLMSGTREAIAQARKTIADDAMDGCTDVFDQPLLSYQFRTRSKPLVTSADVEASLRDLKRATLACRSFTVPNAGSVARAAGSTVLSRLRPTVAPPVGASLLPDDVEAVEEREDLEAARAAWHAARRQQLLAAGGNGGGSGEGEPGEGGQRTMEATVLLKSNNGRSRRMSVPMYLLHPHNEPGSDSESSEDASYPESACRDVSTPMAASRFQSGPAAATSATRAHRPARRSASTASLAAGPSTPLARTTIATPASRRGPTRDVSTPSGAGSVRRRASMLALVPTSPHQMSVGLDSPLHSSTPLWSPGEGGEQVGGPVNAAGPWRASGSNPSPSSNCPTLPPLNDCGGQRPSSAAGDGGNGLASMLAALATGHAEVERVRRRVEAVGAGQARAIVEAAREHMDTTPVWQP